MTQMAKLKKDGTIKTWNIKTHEGTGEKKRKSKRKDTPINILKIK